MNRCLEETDIPKLMTKGKTTVIQKDSKEWQLQTYHVPTDYMEKY